MNIVGILSCLPTLEKLLRYNNLAILILVECVLVRPALRKNLVPAHSQLLLLRYCTPMVRFGVRPSIGIVLIVVKGFLPVVKVLLHVLLSVKRSTAIWLPDNVGWVFNILLI